MLLQRPPERESLKVAAGVSRSERGAGAPRGRREGARVPYALADLVWMEYRTDPGRVNANVFTAEERTAWRGSCPRLRVLKGFGCIAGVIVAGLVQSSNEIWEG